MVAGVIVSCARSDRKIVEPPPPPPAPSIRLSDTTALFTDTVGTADPSAVSISVTSADSVALRGIAVGTISYGAGASGWLTAALSAAAAPATLTLTASSAGLAAGTYTARVPVTATPAVNSPQTITVTFTLSAASPAMALSRTTVAFTDTVGTANPPAETVAVTRADSTSAALTGMVLGPVTYGATASGWLTATLSDSTAPATLTLTASNAGRSAGTYTATVSLSAVVATNSPQTIAVTYTVSPPPPPPPPPPPSGSVVTLAVVGNVGGDCNNEMSRLSSDVVAAARPDYLFLLGNSVRPRSGTVATLEDYQACFEPSWGRFKSIAYVALGSNEVDGDTTSPTAGYAPGADAYFGESHVGPAGRNYWSFDLGSWHVIILDVQSGGPLRPFHIRYKAGSEQLNWLYADLRAHPNKCTLAVWYDAMWMSDNTPPTPTDPNPNHDYRNQPIRGVWTALYENNADLVLNGNPHIYERFFPMRYAEGYQHPTPSEYAADSARGIRQITTGVGGDGPLTAPTPLVTHPLSEYRRGGNGVLQVVLGDSTYSWQFLNSRYSSISDSGTGRCH